MQPMESGQQFLVNLPRAFAVVIFFIGLSIFSVWLKKKDLKLGIIMSLIFGSLIGFKIYIGFFIFPGLLLLFFYYLIKKEYKTVIPIIAIFILSVIIYMPVNSGAGGLYFTGMWRFENFIVSPLLGGLNKLEFARIIYQQHGNWPRVIFNEFIYVILFFFATMGTKLLGLLQVKNSLKYIPKEINILLIAGIFSSLILGSFFGQTSGGSNTFNFLVSIFIIGSIYSALFCFYFLKSKNKYLKIIFILVVLVLTLPRGFNQAYVNLKNIYQGNGFKIGVLELKGIETLSQIKTDSLIVVDPNFSMDKESPYVSFLSNQKMFLSGQKNELEAHNINFSDRLEILNTILNSSNTSFVSAALLENNIGYLFMMNSTNLVSVDSGKFLDTIYSNQDVKILKVNKGKARGYLIKGN